MPETIQNTASPSSDEKPADSKHILERFEKCEDAVRAANFRLATGLAMVFMLVGGSLDPLVEPEYVRTFVIGRLVCACLLGGVLLMMRSVNSGRGLLVLGHLAALIPLITILWMMGYSEGAKSPYYAGLALMLIGNALLMRWRTEDSIFNSALCLEGFGIVFWLKPEDPRIVINNFYFLCVSAVFACAGTFYHNRARLKHFCVLEELEKNRLKQEKNHRMLVAQGAAKIQSFANVSHELRTPLILILSPLDELRRAPAVAGQRHLADLVAMVEEHGLRLLRQVNDLLELIKLDTSEVTIHRVKTNVRLFIGGLTASLSSPAGLKQIRLGHLFETDGGDEVWIDRDKVEQILFNLAINAIKFTPRGGSVDLEARIKAGELQLTVRDTGPGIKQDERSLIFERFWQSDMSSRRQHGGVGIGLSLVKSLTERLGGKVSVDSELGKGSAFLLRLPDVLDHPDELVQESEERPPATSFEEMDRRARLSGVSEPDDSRACIRQENNGGPPLPAQDALRPRVLIADDAASLRDYLADVLTGFDVVTAGDGQEAWDYATQNLPNVIILDYMMPGIDGLDLTRRLRAHPPTSRIPIMVITANVDNKRRQDALDAGANEFITKPFTTVEFNTRVHNLVRQKQYELNLAASKRDLETAHEELRANASRLIQAERLSALGRMSAGIIHEVNNPLNYANAALHLLRSFEEQISEADREDYASVVADAKEGVQRVSRIISDLRAFTKGSPTEMGEISLQAVVNASQRLTNQDLTGIEVEVDVPGDLIVKGSEIQLSQVFINLLQNAASFVLAAKNRGEVPRIEIKARREDNGGVTVTFRDNGCGIAPDDLSMIFEPFFTRRDAGTGMGLGLSITHQILLAHGAKVTVSSERDQYTEFSLCFPPLESSIKGVST